MMKLELLMQIVKNLLINLSTLFWKRVPSVHCNFVGGGLTDVGDYELLPHEEVERSHRTFEMFQVSDYACLGKPKSKLTPWSVKCVTRSYDILRIVSYTFPCNQDACDPLSSMLALYQMFT